MHKTLLFHTLLSDHKNNIPPSKEHNQPQLILAPTRSEDPNTMAVDSLRQVGRPASKSRDQKWRDRPNHISEAGPWLKPKTVTPQNSKTIYTAPQEISVSSSQRKPLTKQSRKRSAPKKPKKGVESEPKAPKAAKAPKAPKPPKAPKASKVSKASKASKAGDKASQKVREARCQKAIATELINIPHNTVKDTAPIPVIAESKNKDDGSTVKGRTLPKQATGVTNRKHSLKNKQGLQRGDGDIREFFVSTDKGQHGETGTKRKQSGDDAKGGPAAKKQKL